MDLLPSGSLNRPTDLLYIDTEDFILSINGLPIHPTVGQLKLSMSTTALLEVKSSVYKSFRTFVFNPLLGQTGNLEEYQDPNVFPVFYENQNYTITIQSKNDNKRLSFYHENRLIREAVQPLKKISGLYTGQLNFRNEVGFSEFEIRINGKVVLIVTFEVFPSKMDYRKDYVQLLHEVNQEVYNLAYDFLKKTFFLSGLKANLKKPSEVEYLSILNHIMENLIQAVDRIEVYPHSKMVQESIIRPIEKVKKANQASQKWVTKNQQYLSKTNTHGILIDGQNYLPQKLLDSKKVKSYDTNENRFLKWMISQLISRLDSFRKRYQSTFQDRVDKEYIRKLESMVQQIRRMVGKEFLKEVGQLSNISISLVLQMGPGYKEVYKFFLMLRKGLAIQSDIYRLSPKEISTLYEYWCFLKIHQILQKKYELVENEMIKVKDNGLFVSLDKTQKGRMRYRNSRNGEVYELVYNPILRSYTTGQRPDHVLSLHKKGSNSEIKFIFDTKYRINPALEGTSYYEKFGTPGPMEEDINTMHRYRDALIYEDKLEKAVTQASYGAYVLFPYENEEEYKQHKLYKSIDYVNIGGLPFLPNHTYLVEKLLNELIEEAPESNFERSLLPRATEEFYQKKTYKQNVLIGALRNKFQYKQVLKNNFYHIQLQAVKNNLSQIKYIALYQHVALGTFENGIVLYGKVKDFRIVKRHEIKEIPKQSEEFYVYFEIESWERLDHVISPEGYGVRWFMLSNIELLKQAYTLPELKLVSPLEMRLWRELRRLSQTLKIDLKNKWVDVEEKDTITIKYEDNELIFNFKDEQLECKVNEKTILFTKKEISYPMPVIKKILEIMTL